MCKEFISIKKIDARGFHVKGCMGNKYKYNGIAIEYNIYLETILMGENFDKFVEAVQEDAVV